MAASSMKQLDRLLEATVSGKKTRKFLPLLAFGALAVILVVYDSGRTYYTDNTELDFLYRFMPEARRVLHLARLKVSYHPPLYPFCLAAVKCFVSTWMTAGLILSGLAGVAGAAASFYYFDRLVGRAAAWGSLLGLGSSIYFLSSASMTTNDMFFFACYSAAWLTCLIAFLKNKGRWWLLAGGAVACTILARTNGIILAPLILLPLLQPIARRTRARCLLAMALAAAVVLGAWVGYAFATGSPLMPTAGTINNLTLTYFPPGPTQLDRISGDAMTQVEGRFHSVWQLFTYAPGHIIKQYCIDLVHMIWANLTILLWAPLAWLAIPGFYFLYRAAVSRRFVLFFFAITLLHMLMINMKAYEPRYYLFLIPPLGAAAVMSVQQVWSYAGFPQMVRMATVGCFALVVTYSLHHEVTAAPYELHPWPEPQTAQIVPTLAHEPANSILVSRTPVDAIGADIGWKYFPLVSNYKVLHERLEKIAKANPHDDVLLLYGSKENSTRPAFHALLHRDVKVPWLTPVADGFVGTPWTVYRFVPGYGAAGVNTNVVADSSAAGGHNGRRRLKDSRLPQAPGRETAANITTK